MLDYISIAQNMQMLMHVSTFRFVTLLLLHVVHVNPKKLGLPFRSYIKSALDSSSSRPKSTIYHYIREAKNLLSYHVYQGIQDFLDFKVSRYCEVYSFWGTCLCLKFQKATSKIEVFLALSCWLYHCINGKTKIIVRVGDYSGDHSYFFWAGP